MGAGDLHRRQAVRRRLGQRVLAHRGARGVEPRARESEAPGLPVHDTRHVHQATFRVPRHAILQPARRRRHYHRPDVLALARRQMKGAVSPVPEFLDPQRVAAGDGNAAGLLQVAGTGAGSSDGELVDAGRREDTDPVVVRVGDDDPALGVERQSPHVSEAVLLPRFVRRADGEVHDAAKRRSAAGLRVDRSGDRGEQGDTGGDPGHGRPPGRAGVATSGGRAQAIIAGDAHDRRSAGGARLRSDGEHNAIGASATAPWRDFDLNRTSRPGSLAEFLPRLHCMGTGIARHSRTIQHVARLSWII